ncbi:DEAD/DEAH box helicase [Bdellovibrio bacteriovorus]|uniref:DEAD-box ATP-dependent RNA helicase RhpA n=1 Tax=Bdellovibrio bacteriovorus TaxID=959 RepID=A0A150WCH5_BDEBC|nr:DEAD/DEAH box helicase [Bdellovibrio bacteriovorus]KYG60647.1 DEAD/DEAH box helicase [Bdellovibrio bacteriovorus]
MTTTKFTDLPLVAPLQFALKEAGYENPTPIQLAAIPILLQGKDLLGIAQTGTGKTAAFSLPILQNLAKHHSRPEAKCPRALILTPTRELAIQIHENIEAYSKHLKLKHAVIYGGVGQNPQVRALQAGVDILVATPGRLLDLFSQKFLRLDKVEIFVLDEADRMLDMGFMQDIKRILPLLPKKRHNLFFSATMPPEISKLAHSILVNPEKVEVTPTSSTAEKVDQKVMYVEKKDKLDLLIHLLNDNDLYKVLVFVQMKHGANRVVDKLVKANITAAGIHGDKSQNARQRALEDFRNGDVRVLVATDIAARGIDIEGITHVINLEVPHIPESYVHRIGRTARAGASGAAISFCTAEEKSFMFAIEKVTRQPVPVVKNQPYHSEAIEKAQVMSAGKAKAILEGQRLENKAKNRAGQKPKRSFGGGSGGGKPKSSTHGGGNKPHRQDSAKSPAAHGESHKPHRHESGKSDASHGGNKPHRAETPKSGSSHGGSHSGKPAKATPHKNNGPSGGGKKSEGQKPKRRFFGFGRKG